MRLDLPLKASEIRMSEGGRNQTRKNYSRIKSEQRTAGDKYLNIFEYERAGGKYTEVRLHAFRCKTIPIKHEVICR